jgi:hypothetical protein
MNSLDEPGHPARSGQDDDRDQLDSVRKSGRRNAHYWRVSRRAFAALTSAVSNPSVNRS